ncbi:hypothetical protein ALI144C_50140 [Actinosynnema sp. ALI-1.44]|nr:hypothetical protein ALI144C_50140 [Actinosynnema sp. ALI-1.44]
MSAAVLVVGVCLTVWFTVARPRGPENVALVDLAATNAVTDQVGRTLRTVFSYDPSQMDRTAVAAQDVLVGAAIEQYNTQFQQARKEATDNKQVLTTAVRSVGVVDLRPDSARLLVFVDRQLVKGDKHESGAAQLLVSAVKSGDVWKISDIRFL